MLLLTPKACVCVCVLEEDIWNSNANIKGCFSTPLGTRHLCKPPRRFGSVVCAETAQAAACRPMLLLRELQAFSTRLKYTSAL